MLKSNVKDLLAVFFLLFLSWQASFVPQDYEFILCSVIMILIMFWIIYERVRF